MSLLRAYLEDYHYLKIIMPKSETFNDLFIRRLDQPHTYKLQIDKIENFNEQIHLHCSFQMKIELNLDYEIIINQKTRFPLFLGKITKTKRFEIENYFNDWLGYQYSHKKTTFRVWSPVSKEMYLILNNEKHKMEYLKNGVWEVTVFGDLDLTPYFYLFRINDEFITSLDPYGISTNELKTCNYVINHESLYQPNYDYIKCEKEKMIIYELNIHDFTSGLNIEHPGTFKGIIESKEVKELGINYLKSLGITHVQLMPIFEFGGVNDKVKKPFDPNFLYNWGYNPEQFFVPSGWYATDLENPKTRINELREMIDFFHQNKIGVNMDVVYNHVYDYTTFSIGQLVPGYAYRTDKRGFLTSSSGCGNDISSERKMMTKFIIDNVMYYQTFYKIDGFRFDLMGLLNVELMNEVYQVTNQINKYSYIYGEGWNMTTYLPQDREANQTNYWQMPNIGFFNDQYRDFFQKRNNNKPKFTFGEKYDYKKLMFLLNGSEENDMLYLSRTQSVNYIESHDDMSFYDTLLENNNNDEYAKDKVKLVLDTLLISKGISFIHSGMELLRTKKGNRNTYNLGDEYNHFPWENYKKNQDVFKNVKMFIKLRKDTYHLKAKYEYIEDLDVIKVSWENYILEAFIKNNYDEVTIKGELLNKPGVYLI